MRLPFSGRNEKLETMNRILTEAARKRTERIEELERRVAQLERELEPACRAIERAKELEVVAAERAHLLNEKDKQLADVREVATNTIFGFKSWNAPWRKWARSDGLPDSFLFLRARITNECRRTPSRLTSFSINQCPKDRLSRRTTRLPRYLAMSMAGISFRLA